MTRFLLTADLHQFIPKWEQLVAATIQERPHFVLIAGDLLPKTTHESVHRTCFVLSKTISPCSV